MGENSNRLSFRSAGLSPTESREGSTAYEATAGGVTYRIVGTLVDAAMSSRRTFRAFRVTGATGHTLHPAAEGGEHKTRAAAYAQAEADLAEVLRDREAEQRQAAAMVVDRARAAQYTPCDGCGVRYPLADLTKTRTVAAGSSESELHCPACESERSSHDRITTTTAARRAEIGIDARPTSADQLAQQVAGRELRPELSLDEIMAQDPVGPADVAAQPGRQSAWTVFHDTMSAAIRAAEALTVQPPKPTDPATEDNVPELVDRIVRCAQYEALKTMLGVLDGWTEGARSNCEANSHRVAWHDGGRPCGEQFEVEDIRRMVNDAARELGTAEPWADR